MRLRKARLTVTVDRALIEAGNRAVAAGQADSLSGWVNLALAERVERERGLRAMAEAVAAYEKEFGAISAEEIAAQARRDREAAIRIRGRRGTGRPKRRRAA